MHLVIKMKVVVITFYNGDMAHALYDEDVNIAEILSFGKEIWTMVSFFLFRINSL